MKNAALLSVLLAASPAFANPRVAALDPEAPAAATAAAKPTEPDLGGTFEIALGYGSLAGEVPGLGTAIGFGGFVAPNIALSVRASGVAIPYYGLIWAGVVGPNAQVWLGENAWFGAGVGAAVAGCDGCGGGNLGLGFSGRFGLSRLPRGESSANLTLEVSAFSGVVNYMVGIGFQSF